MKLGSHGIFKFTFSSYNTICMIYSQMCDFIKILIFISKLKYDYLNFKRHLSIYGSKR